MSAPRIPARRLAAPDVPPHDDDRPPPEEPDFATDLFAYARQAMTAAYRLTPDTSTSISPGRGVEALAFVRAAKEALQARQLAEDPLPAGERAAIAAQVTMLRRQVCAAEERRAALEGQRDAVTDLLNTVIVELGDHGGAVSAAQARRELDAIFPDASDRQAATEARADLGEDR